MKKILGVSALSGLFMACALTACSTGNQSAETTLADTAFETNDSEETPYRYEGKNIVFENDKLRIEGPSEYNYHDENGDVDVTVKVTYLSDEKISLEETCSKGYTYMTNDYRLKKQNGEEWSEAEWLDPDASITSDGVYKSSADRSTVSRTYNFSEIYKPLTAGTYRLETSIRFSVNNLHTQTEEGENGETVEETVWNEDYTDTGIYPTFTVTEK